MFKDLMLLPSFGGHLRMVRGGVSEAAVFEEVYSTASREGPSLIHLLKSPSIPLVALRHLATQSFNLFENIQNMKEIDLESVVTKSREYRAILAECEEQIIIEIKFMDDDMKYDEERYNLLTTHCNIVRDYQLLWHLAEIFFIKISSGGYLIQDLQGWLNLQQPHVSFKYNQLMDSYNSANGDIEIENDESYWSTVLCLAMHGRMSEILNMLACHTLSNSQAFRAVRSIVELIPIYGPEFEKCHVEFELMWKKWHKRAEETLVDSCLLSPYPKLVILADILLGKQDVYSTMEVIDAAEGCWYYAVVPYFLYTHPLINVKEVCSSFKNFRKRFQLALTSFENVATEVCSEQILQTINAIFNLDLGEFISTLSRNSNNWWLPAHLIDIIEKINPHLFPSPLRPVNESEIFDEDTMLKEVCSMKEFFVLQYSSGLLSHTSLILTALNYIHFCPVMGAAQIAEIIDHLYFPTDQFAVKIHSWCLQHTYHEVALLMCKRQGMQALKRRCIGSSLSWAIKGKDTNLMNRIADTLLKELLSSVNSEFENECMDTLEGIKNISLGMCGKKMTFVIKFYEVKVLIKDAKYEEASTLLMQLLQCSLVSARYNVDILKNVKSLIAVEGIFKVNDLYSLMETLEDSKVDELDEEVNELRRLMVVQLSRVCLL